MIQGIKFAAEAKHVQRPHSYTTRHGKAVLVCLMDFEPSYVTAAQVQEHLRRQNVAISRPTVYRQLERLVSSGRARKHLFDGVSVNNYQYVDSAQAVSESYNLICEVCERAYSIQCEEVDQVSQHVFTEHGFQINESKTVFYGKCRDCVG